MNEHLVNLFNAEQLEVVNSEHRTSYGHPATCVDQHQKQVQRS